MTTTTNPHSALLAAVLAGIVLTTGCHSTGSTIPTSPQPYPSTAKRGTVLDIQVVKHPTEIEFTNTSARAFGKSTIWLNARFHRGIDSIAIGQTVTLPLNEFIDEFGDAFRGAGFWSKEDPDKLVLTQIETVNSDGVTELVGLITVRSNE